MPVTPEMSSAGAFVYSIRWITLGGVYCCFRGFVIVVLIIVFILAIVEVSAPPLIHQPDLRNSEYLLPRQ